MKYIVHDIGKCDMVVPETNDKFTIGFRGVGSGPLKAAMEYLQKRAK